MPIFNPNKHSNNNHYDVKEAARKFREKHGKSQIDPFWLRYYSEFYMVTKDQYLESQAKYNAEAKNEILDAIEKNGSDAINSTITEQDPWGPGELPLTVAIHLNDQPLVKFLLQHGANPNKATTYSYRTAHGLQHQTVYPIEYIHSVKMAQYLKENGADISPLFNDPSNSLRIEHTPDLLEYVEKERTEFNKQNQLLDAKIQK
jgi:ankyrin repeat protein